MSTFRRVAAARAALCAVASLACPHTAMGAASDPPVSNPLGGGQGVTLEPASPPAAARRHRAVFVCQEGGVPVYTDRPCGSGAVVRGLVVETPRPGATASTTPPAPRSSTRPRPAPAPADANVAPVPETRCGMLQRRVDELDARMRAGYSAREAARLWQRWREARERLRQARC